VRHLSHPGGSPWLGDAADAAHDLAYADRRVVYQAADKLRDAAKIANQGAQELSHARGLALEAIADAEADEFAVGNDLSVTDTRRYTTREIAQYTARQTVAETHQSYIALRAGALASADAEIGARLHASAEEFRSLLPLDWTKTTDGSNDTSVQALDHGRHPQSPASDCPLSIQNAEDVHRVVDPQPPGRHPGVKTLPTPEAIAALYAQLTENRSLDHRQRTQVNGDFSKTAPRLGSDRPAKSADRLSKFGTPMAKRPMCTWPSRPNHQPQNLLPPEFR
jgi:hypothetical protein